MNWIVAGQGDEHETGEVYTADLGDLDPDPADLVGIAVLDEHDEFFHRSQERLEARMSELALYGGPDELATRRYRRQVHALLQQTYGQVTGGAA